MQLSSHPSAVHQSRELNLKQSRVPSTNHSEMIWNDLLPEISLQFQAVFFLGKFFVSSGSPSKTNQLVPPKLMDWNISQPCCFILMYALILALILSLVLDLTKNNRANFTNPIFLVPTLWCLKQEETRLNTMEIYHSGISYGAFSVTRDLETVHFICFHCSLYAACLTRPMTSGPPWISTTPQWSHHSWLENPLGNVQ